jgi:hypothetical protein
MKAAVDEANAVVKEAFSAASRELFEKHPEMDTFSWTQYTPHYNDGDQCEFHVRFEQECISINGCDSYEIYDYTEWVNGKLVLLPEDKIHSLNQAQKNVAEFLEEFDEGDYEAMFGDHCEVLVKRDGTIEVSGYSHD